MNPNSLKYFDEENGCTKNSKCSKCETSIYIPERIDTVYDGKKYYHNRTTEIVGVFTFNGNLCNECWEKQND